MILVAYFPEIPALYQAPENRLPISVTKIRFDGGGWRCGRLDTEFLRRSTGGRDAVPRTPCPVISRLCKQNGHVNIVNYVELRGLISACCC